MRSLRRLLIASVMTTVLVVLVACQGTISVNARFRDCKIEFADETVPDGAPSPMAAYLNEVSAFTGMPFVQVPAAEIESHFDPDRSTLLIQDLVGGDPGVVGTEQPTAMIVDRDGNNVIVSTVIKIRPGSDPAVRRHELGHLFNLAHDRFSALMRPYPAVGSDFTPIERHVMKMMAERSSCATADNRP